MSSDLSNAPEVLAKSSHSGVEPLTVDIRDASRWASLPPSIHFQRRANQWLSRLRKHAHSSGALPIQCGTTPLDVLDALRSVLNITNGAALTNIAIAQAALDQFPDRTLSFVENEVGQIFIDSISELAAVTSRIRLQRNLAKSFWLPKLRAAGRSLRDSAVHRLGSIISSKGPPAERNIIAVPRLPAHFADLLPVTRALQRIYGVSTIIAAASPDIYALARAEQLRVVPLRGSSARDVQSLLGSKESRLPQLMRVIQSQSAEEDLVNEVENRTLICETCRVLAAHYASVIDVAVACTQLIDHEQPSLLAVGNPYTFEGRTAVGVARCQGIPTFALEHGSIFPDDPIWQECVVDRVCVWGEPSYRALRSCGLAEEQIAITGGPRFDVVLKDDAVSTSAEIGERDFILVATSGPGDQVTVGQHRLFIEMLYEVADRLPEVQFVVKLHKKDREEYYQLSAGKAHPRFKIVRGQRSLDGLEIFEFLKRARGMVTICSSCALDAMAVRVPVIAVDVWWPAAAIKGVEFLENGGTRKVQGVPEFVNAVQEVWQGRQALSDEIAREYADRHFVNRGTAAEAVAREMVSAMNGASIV